MTEIPVEHLQDALELTQDYQCKLYVLSLKTTPTVIRFWAGVEREWQGQRFVTLPCQISGRGEFADNQVARPRLTILNPEGIFGPFADTGVLDLAVVQEYTVLQRHFVANQNIFRRRTWFVGNVARVTYNLIELNLRVAHDLPAFRLPARRFMPPEFPIVSY